MIHKIEFRAMGCRILAALDCAPSQASVLNHVPPWFEEWEQALSRFRFDSELSRLNRSAGRPFSASSTLWEVAKLSRQAEEQSGGLVSPFVLDALEQAGYDRSFEALADSRGGLRDDFFCAGELDLQESGHLITLAEGARLDFGGVAKGWAAHQAMQRLAEYGAALVDAGGDIAVSGMLEGEVPWPVAVRSPLDESASLALLGLGRSGVATSGQDYRRWLFNGAWQHHLIDPRTGQPAETDVLTATVVAPTVLQAEMAAKTVFLLGSLDGLNWLEDRPELSGLLVLTDGSLIQTASFTRFLWSEVCPIAA